ncbi:MAG: antibiotic biosynthesis monooxygenase [Desulfobacterales bacterium]|nr:antibiotic biosynthesis monooxygenase [Desulfobacterales bacterium]
MSKIIRIWYGLADKEHADDYNSHVKNDIFPLFTKMSGNLGAKVLRQEREEGVEFVVITAWDSMEAIKEFAKDDVDKAVVANVAQPYFIRYDKLVSHYTVDSELGNFD